LFVYFCSWLRATIYEYRKHKIVIINELSKPLAFFISIIFHLRNLSYISKDNAARINAEVKNSLRDWKTVARRLGLPERDIDIFGGRFIIG
ncbi:MAG: death domain-containing protein, partial [Bacteroidales bacterium]|nr:death domain-containing protein [Bacteroidales bacterium]